MEINMGCTYDGMHILLNHVVNGQPRFDYFDERHRFLYRSPRYNGQDNAIWEIPCDSTNISWFSRKYGRNQNIMNLWWPDLARVIDCWYGEYMEDIPNVFDKLISDSSSLGFLSGWSTQHWVIYSEWDRN